MSIPDWICIITLPAFSLLWTNENQHCWDLMASISAADHIGQVGMATKEKKISTQSFVTSIHQELVRILCRQFHVLAASWSYLTPNQTRTCITAPHTMHQHYKPTHLVSLTSQNVFALTPKGSLALSNAPVWAWAVTKQYVVIDAE